MSQFSETTIADLLHLGYPDGHISNDYYTAQVLPGVGICVAIMANKVYAVQFFPWDMYPRDTGHGRYGGFIMAKATAGASAASVCAVNQELFRVWPFELCNINDGILVLKCLIEETIKSLETKNADQNISADPAAGQAVE